VARCSSAAQPTAADWADEDGVRSSREAITIPTASEATMIKNE
jgi:hypothetical protein